MIDLAAPPQAPPPSPPPMQPAAINVDWIVVGSEIALVLGGPLAWFLSGVSLVLVRLRIPFASALSEMLLALASVVAVVACVATGQNPAVLYLSAVGKLISAGPGPGIVLAAAPVSLLASWFFVRVSLWRPEGARRHRRIDPASSRWAAAYRIDLTRSLTLTTLKGRP